ncbi:unnamed protein product [Protopolystoma xenopodis]|uniref:Uncharacterized protein n=1 Tax=Protopolystoma xenopodis TaxID=117903 RepID=A0A3S5AD80_9PLAT|nr:unnamed protein product [Protopolystoma xenopodis]
MWRCIDIRFGFLKALCYAGVQRQSPRQEGSGLQASASLHPIAQSPGRSSDRLICGLCHACRRLGSGSPGSADIHTHIQGCL